MAPWNYALLFLALAGQVCSECVPLAPGEIILNVTDDADSGELLWELKFTGLIKDGSVSLDSSSDAFDIMTVTSAQNGTDDTTTLTFTANENFTNYLDLNPNSVLEKVSLIWYICEEATTNSSINLTLSFTDTNNRAPLLTIQDPNVHINLETWHTSIPLTIRYPIQVIDADFSEVNGMVSLRTIPEGYLVDIEPILEDRRLGGRDRGRGPFTYRYNLFLHPDVRPGNYTVPLSASDGANTGSLEVQLYIAGGIQARAAGFALFPLLCLSVWLNFK